jgi:hypothetical protein
MLTTEENPRATSAIGIRFSAHTKPHRKLHINQRYKALFSCGLSQALGLSAQIFCG